MVDVRIPWGITHTNRGGPSLRTLEETVDKEIRPSLKVTISGNKFDFKEEHK